MRVYNYKLSEGSLTITVDEAAGAISGICVEGNEVSLPEGKVKDVKYDVVVLPWGATEPHNLHLPYLTDCILPHDIAVDAAALALERSGVPLQHR